jgi:hypothetical protein
MKILPLIMFVLTLSMTMAQDMFRVTFVSDVELKVFFYNVTAVIGEDSIKIVPDLEKVSYPVKYWKIHNEYHYDVYLPYDDLNVVGVVNNSGQIKLAHIYTTTKDKGGAYKTSLKPDFSNLQKYLILYYDEEKEEFATIVRSEKI